MQQLDTRRVALALGSFTAFMHLIWVILIVIGWAKPLIGFILMIHNIQIPYDIAPFSILNAVVLIIVTFAIGNIFGFIFASGWNMCRKH